MITLTFEHEILKLTKGQIDVRMLGSKQIVGDWSMSSVSSAHNQLGTTLPLWYGGGPMFESLSLIHI